ncbi:hypothetical protein ACLOJK_015928 [Asimina triloba]
MVAHVGDFGLATFPSAIAQSSTVGMKGSIGYIAPEYAMGGKASSKGDVYSYGILLLEIMTGRGPTDAMFENNLTLHHHVRLALLADRVGEIADPYLLLEEANQALRLSDDSKKKMHECLGSMARIGVACSAESPGERMKMNEVGSQRQLRRIEIDYYSPLSSRPSCATASRDYGKGPDLKMQSLKGTFESTHKSGNTNAQKKSSQADKDSEGNGVHKHKCFADSNVILTDSKEQTVDHSKDGSFCLQIMYTLDCRFWVFFCFSDSGHARITRKKWKSEICCTHAFKYKKNKNDA